MKFLLTLVGVIFTVNLYAQIYDFPQLKTIDFTQNTYQLDSTANAIVLLEKGKSYISESDADRAYMVYHTYQVRIKILKPEGFDAANFSIPLYKYGSTFERVIDVKAYTLNLVDGKIDAHPLSNKEIVSENKSEYARLTKFTLPNIQVGSIIDVQYTIISPDIFNFRSWAFQSEIPKLKSEYNVLIPAVYTYNITLQGFLKLKDTKSSLERGCLSIFNTRVDCSNITYIMDDIPAFQEEPHMLAAKNYRSAVNFELQEVTRPNGSSQKFTKDWKNVDFELMTDRNFGGQLKKEDFFKELLLDSEVHKIENKTDKAEYLYRWIQDNIRWNNYLGKYKQNGVEDAFTKKSGNIADINFALINALNAVGLEAYPVLVSTRDNGLPNDLHPVISNFNYVIAALKTENDIILLDASDPLLMFSALPLRAINGKGRIIYSKKSSEWISLENKIVAATSYIFDGKLNLDGTLTGSFKIVNRGLDAYIRRKEILNYPSIEEYKEKFDERISNIDIKNMDIDNLTDAKNMLIANMDVDILMTQPIREGDFTLQPIFIDRTTKNPFNLDERLYPVDLGTQKDEIHEIHIELPPGVTLKSAPKDRRMTLPENSARYIYKSEIVNQKLLVSQMLSLKKAIYSTDEYFGLKELYSRIIQQLQVDYVFNYKK